MELQMERELPEGAYYYLIDFEQNGTIDYEGWLYLTRLNA